MDKPQFPDGSICTACDKGRKMQQYHEQVYATHQAALAKHAKHLEEQQRAKDERFKLPKLDFTCV
jgi:hypothetical protein